MQIHLSPRHLRLTAAIHQYAAAKVEELEDLGAEIIAAHIVLVHTDTAALEARYKVKVHLAIAGPDIFAEQKSSDLYLAIDGVIAKLARQLRKRKTRLTDKRRQTSARTNERRRAQV